MTGSHAPCRQRRNYFLRRHLRRPVRSPRILHVPAFQLSPKRGRADLARAGGMSLRDVSHLQERVLRGVGLSRRQQVTQPVQGVTARSPSSASTTTHTRSSAAIQNARLGDFGVGQSGTPLLVRTRAFGASLPAVITVMNEPASWCPRVQRVSPATSSR